MTLNTYHVWTCNRPYTWRDQQSARLVNGTSNGNAAREAIETMAEPYRRGALVAINGPLSRLHVRESTSYYRCIDWSPNHTLPLNRRVRLSLIKAEEFVDDRDPTDAELRAHKEPAVRVRRRISPPVPKNTAQEPPGSPLSEPHPKVAPVHCAHGLEHATAGVAAHERRTCHNVAAWYVEPDPLPGEAVWQARYRYPVCETHVHAMLTALHGERYFRLRPVVYTLNSCARCWRTATRMHVSFLGVHLGSLCEACVQDIARAMGGTVAARLGGA